MGEHKNSQRLIACRKQSLENMKGSVAIIAFVITVFLTLEKSNAGELIGGACMPGWGSWTPVGIDQCKPKNAKITAFDLIDRSTWKARLCCKLCEDEKMTGRKGAGYRGCQTVTRSGKTCQAWYKQSPHPHTRTPEKYPDAGLDMNFCRNPDGSKTIWCYVDDPSAGYWSRWEYCDPINFVTTSDPNLPKRKCNEHVSGKNGAGYRGCQTKTKSGKTCQAWDSQTPHKHGNTPENRPYAGLVMNFCRNPKGVATGGIWCYTEESGTRAEYCDPLA